MAQRSDQRPHRPGEHGAEIPALLKQQVEPLREQRPEFSLGAGRGVDAVAATAEMGRHRLDAGGHIAQEAAGQSSGAVGAEDAGEPRLGHARPRCLAHDAQRDRLAHVAIRTKVPTAPLVRCDGCERRSIPSRPRLRPAPSSANRPIRIIRNT